MQIKERDDAFEDADIINFVNKNLNIYNNYNYSLIYFQKKLLKKTQKKQI